MLNRVLILFTRVSESNLHIFVIFSSVSKSKMTFEDLSDAFNYIRM